MTLVLAQEAATQTYLIWGVVLAVVAFILVLVELFIPSGGLISAMAGVAAIGSITAFFMHDIMAGTVAVGLYLVLTPIFLWAVFKFWIHSPMARYMILGGSDLNDADGAAEGSPEISRLRQLEQLRALIGAEGVTVTPLRPVGTVRIEGERVDAMAETGTIDANVPIVVTDVYDNQIKVRPR